MIRVHFILLLIFLLSCTSEKRTLTDVDGNEYSVKLFEGKLWMTENLRVTKTSEGEKISFYYPNSDTAYAQIYGLLYNYATACTVCPSGWRLPTNEEWDKLFALASDNNAGNFKDQNYWDEVNENSSTFSARPAGSGNVEGHDNFFGYKSYFLSKTLDDEFAWTYILEKGESLTRKASQHTTYGFSVRCVKD
ncbi:MAG: fibrobacter succinogenes major paralogous domain-containing protein [Cyclobacteriaceae bacterium]